MTAKFSFSDITKQQTNIIKGIAMLVLVLHNYIHWTNRLGENEMELDPNRFFELINSIIEQPTFFINGIFTFFGFYGIEPFILLSAYGLTKKYGDTGISSYKKYIMPNIIKIYSLLIFGIILYIGFFYQEIVEMLVEREQSIAYMIASILSMTNNFSAEKIFLYKGIAPWWFFSLILQLYILYPFLLKVTNKYKEKGLAILFAASYALIFALYYLLKGTEDAMLIFGNAVGHLPEFILGIALAKCKNITIGWKVLVPTLAIFALSHLYFPIYPFTFITASILFLVLCTPFLKNTRNWISRSFAFLGSISMFMFLFNGPIRIYTRRTFVDNFDDEIHLLITAMMHLAIVILSAYLASLLYNKTFKPWSEKLIARFR